MINFYKFYQTIAITNLKIWLNTLPSLISLWNKQPVSKQINFWKKSASNIPLIEPQHIDLLNGVSAYNDLLTKFEQKNIIKLLQNLKPWRKGPFFLYNFKINAEWQSNLKWNRISPYISSLVNRTVLDVGCGNGYYMWRMIGMGAKLVVGIDPNHLYLYQFEAIRKLLGNMQNINLIPIKFEELPKLKAFDTVFSMGVIYHRRSPLDHLIHLNNQLVSNGELILETLVISGDINTILVPKNCYARMKNVYFIPSIAAIKNWLKKCKFINIRIISCTKTSTIEQRSTEWMQKESLLESLDTKDINKTIEGYPAPYRAILIANKSYK